MEGIEAIVQAILQNANSEAEQILQNAKIAHEKEIDGAKVWAVEYVKENDTKAKEEVDNILVKNQTLANLESKKIVLGAKQQVINSVFEMAVEKLLNMQADKYLKFVTKLIEDNAEQNESILLCKNSPIKAEQIMQLQVVKERNLQVKEGGNFKGGIIIEGVKYDKQLSFTAIVDNLKQELESSLAEKLFN